VRTLKSKKGFTLIELLIVIAVIAILAAIAIPNLLSSKKGANESNAISTLKTMSTSEETYKSRNLSGSNTYGTIAQLVTSQIMTFASGATAPFKNSGYTYSDVGTPSNTQYAMKAEPNDSSAGTRSFAITEDGFVREKATSAISETHDQMQASLSVISG
jgi:prepilin-type N-terminal cleavage/methylation domain-containing protein